MQLFCEESRTICIVTIQGKCDAISSENLEAYLAAIIEKKKGDIIIECNEIEYLSSGGMRALLLNLHEIQKQGRNMVLCDLPPHIQEVLDLAGVSKYFEQYSSLEEAKRAIHS
jgi:anti-sigma B factor antagonist